MMNITGKQMVLIIHIDIPFVIDYWLLNVVIQQNLIKNERIIPIASDNNNSNGETYEKFLLNIKEISVKTAINNETIKDCDFNHHCLVNFFT